MLFRSLTGAGFGSAGTGDEGGGLARTVVRYQAGQAGAADLVARYLEAGAELQIVTESLAADVVVITGGDYAGVRAAPTPPTSSTSTPPSTTATSTTGSTSSTSTSTVIGQVPEPPPGRDC